MSYKPRTERHENGIVKLKYLPFDIATFETALPFLSDAELGELTRALFDYERSGGEVLPQIKGNGNIIAGACIKNIEQARSKIISHHEAVTKGGAASAKKRKEIKELQPLS